MGQIIVRNLDDDIKRSLKRRAAQHGISMEAEARLILGDALKERESTSPGLGSKIIERFAQAGLDQPLPELHGQSIDPMEL